MSEIKLFKIRAADGTFSTGGTYPNFTKNGKSWTTMAFLKAHIREADKNTRQKYITKGCQVVEYVTTEASVTDMSDIFDEVAKRQKELQDERAATHERWKRNQELEQLKKLKEKYPNEN